MNTQLTQPIRLLLVDDDESCRDSLGEFFRREGFHVSFAVNGTEAYHRFTSFEVDCSVMDVHMPGMTGLDVLRRLVAEPGQTVVPPTVFISSDAQMQKEVERITHLALGLQLDFVPKPIRLDAMRRSLRQLLLRYPPKPTP